MKPKLIDGRVWLNTSEFSGKCHVQDFVLPNPPLEYNRISIHFVQNFPRLIKFKESRRDNSVIFSYLESLKNIVKENSRAYLCHF